MKNGARGAGLLSVFECKHANKGIPVPTGRQQVICWTRLGDTAELAEKEAKGEQTTPPGLPADVASPKDFITDNCVKVWNI